MGRAPAPSAPREPFHRLAPSGPSGQSGPARQPLESAWGDAPLALRELFQREGDERWTTPRGELPARLLHVRTGLRFLLVPGGDLHLGSAPGQGGGRRERPMRRVRLRTFYVSETEVTARAWRLGGGRAGEFASVSWERASAWCGANGLRLPSEAQWEYAAAGSADALFPWGSDYGPECANARGLSAHDPWVGAAPPGRFERDRSWCGALDMGGNLREWCRDVWEADYEALPVGSVDPLREGAGALRAVRGGSYYSRRPTYLRCAQREGFEAEQAAANLGLRPVFAW